MPEVISEVFTSNRTICVFSAPVTVLTDELMAELVKRLPREACLEILRTAVTQAHERLLAQKVRNRRSDAYKALKLTRTMADRLRPLPDDLAVLLGEKSADGVPVEGIAAEPEDDFGGIADDIPEFKQYSSVFRKYPYYEVRDTSLGKLLVLGYSSGKGRISNKTYRRNCMLITPEGNRMQFREMGSAIGVLQETGLDGTHYTIKAIPYADGQALKFWTNIIGERDVPDLYGYRLLTDGVAGLVHITEFTTEVEWEATSNEYRTFRKSHADKPPVTYVTQRTKPLSQLRASDVPRGMDAADLATDCR